MGFNRVELVDLHEFFPTRAVGGRFPPADLLLVVNGFEDRSTRYVELLAKFGASVPAAATMRFNTNRSDNEARLGSLESGLANLGATNTFIDVADIDEALPAYVVETSSQTRFASTPFRVTFDISAASGRIILRVIRCLFQLARTDDVAIELTIAYTEATEYAPTQADAEATLASLRPHEDRPADASTVDAMSVGPDWEAHDDGVDVVYTGQSAEGLAERAVVICGFNADRVRVALDAVDPAFNSDMPHPGVTYIAGEPPAEQLRWRLEVMKQINSYGADTSDFDFHDASTLEYLETLYRLEDVYNNGFGSQRMTIIPFGSKMQTLAAALFCELHPDVRAHLVAPKRYAGSDYSNGNGPTHTLSFGDLKTLVGRMASLGNLQYVAREGATTGWTTSTS